MNRNRTWNLEAFLDSLIIELDKARETLAIKAINKPLTYAVKDVNLEMQLFPSFDGKNVQFITAEPGQTGASKIAIQLGSITDQQIRKTTKGPVTKDEIAIDVIEDLDEDTKKDLQKIGVSSINDLEKIERKNVDLNKVSNRKLNYKHLASLLNKARRREMKPSLNSAGFSLEEGNSLLEVAGENLLLDQNFEPVAVFNGEMVDVVSGAKSTLSLKVDAASVKDQDNELIVVLDPYTVFKVNINNTPQ